MTRFLPLSFWCCRSVSSWLPNIELVSLLMILYTLVFRRHVWFILSRVPVILEGLIYGFGLWWFSYLYVWASCVQPCFSCDGPENRGHSAALLAGIFGMLFGLLCAVSYFLQAVPEPRLPGGQPEFPSTLSTASATLP